MKKKTIILFVIAGIVGLLTGAASWKILHDNTYKKACGSNLIDWWSLLEEYKKTNPQEAGTKEPYLGSKLTATAGRLKRNVPADRCPLTGIPYVFTTRLPSKRELPCTCTTHLKSIRWQD